MLDLSEEATVGYSGKIQRPPVKETDQSIKIVNISVEEVKKLAEDSRLMLRLLTEQFPELAETFKNDTNEEYGFRGVRWTGKRGLLKNISQEEAMKIIIENLESKGSDFVISDREAGLHLQVGKGGNEYPFERSAAFALQGEEREEIQPGQLSFLSVYKVKTDGNLNIESEALHHPGGNIKRFVPLSDHSWSNMRKATVCFKVT